MNKTVKNIVYCAIVVPPLTIAVYYRAVLEDLYRTYPTIHHRILRRTLRHLFLDALSGKTGDITDYNDEQMDHLFRTYIVKYA